MWKRLPLHGKISFSPATTSIRSIKSSIIGLVSSRNLKRYFELGNY
jgi:hypothetical protein